MNLNSREIRRLNIKSFFNRRCLWRCCRCCLNYILLLEQRASSSTFEHQFERPPSAVCLDVHYSAVHSVVIVGQGTSICLLFKLLFKFRNVLKHTESRSSLACNQTIKEDNLAALEVFFCFETKRNDINRSSTGTSTQRTSNIRGRTGYNI